MMVQLLADAMGCSAEELVITRNTTESLDTIIAGYPWNVGDEAVLANQDYGAMINMFWQVSDRHGVKLNFVDVPLHPKSDEEIVNIYEQAITPKTRLLMICHMINITGHILPVRKIVDMAHSKGVEVMVDGAHTFAHIEFDIPSLGCDYFGTSLHKWLSAPLGLGALYVKKGKEEKIWPLFGQNDHPRTDIRHLNHVGTHPYHSVLTIQDALAYYFRLGPDKKEERLRYLQRYWTERARNYDYVLLNTPSETNRACGIANFGIKGMDPGQLADRLLNKYGIWTVAINNAGVHGVRITPNIFTLRADMDRLVAAIEDMAP
jgi:selenocysteine lyase/cysteine desulfurase